MAEAKDGTARLKHDKAAADAKAVAQLATTQAAEAAKKAEAEAAEAKPEPKKAERPKTK